MRIKDVNINKIDELIKSANPDLYISSISFENGNYILNLSMPFDDSEKRAEIIKKISDEYQEWARKMDAYFAAHPEL